MNLSELDAVFSANDIEWRISRAGQKDGKVWATCLAYITNRAIMQRLDEVCGKENWRNEFKEWHGQSQLCGISIKIDGEWITKWDGAENTATEPTKGGLSGSMKRAGAQWGIGRYLYNLEETFAIVHSSGKKYGRLSQRDGGQSFKWDAPDLPNWALPVPKKAVQSQNGKADKVQLERYRKHAIEQMANFSKTGKLNTGEKAEWLKEIMGAETSQAIVDFMDRSKKAKGIK